jgi:hypothetical protein
MAALIAGAAMQPTGDEAARWAAWSGAYQAPSWGVIDPIGPPGRFLVDHGVPYIESNETGALVRHRLVEVEPNVFLADNGETLDLAGPRPRWGGIGLVRLAEGPAPWQWAILGTAALLAAMWLLAALARTVRRSRSPSAGRRGAAPGWRRITVGVATVTAGLAVATVALVVWMPGLVDSGFIGWLEFPTLQRLALHLPLALAVFTGGTVALTAAGWVRRWWTGAESVQYTVLASAAMVLVVQLAAWRLIGWGIS